MLGWLNNCAAGGKGMGSGPRRWWSNVGATRGGGCCGEGRVLKEAGKESAAEVTFFFSKFK